MKRESKNFSAMRIILNIILNKLELYSVRRNAIINLIGKESNFRNKYFFQMTNITRIFDDIYKNDKQKNLHKLSRDIGLIHIYKQTIDQWILDDDMSKIMSFLDQKLIKSGEIFSILFTLFFKSDLAIF